MPFNTYTPVSSAARTTSGNSGAITSSRKSATVLNLGLDVAAQSGTTPTLDVSVEWSFDGTTFFVAQPADSYTQITAATPKVVKRFDMKAPIYRVVWAIAGTTPSYTFSVTAFDNQPD